MNFIKSVENLYSKNIVNELDFGLYSAKSKKLIDLYLNNPQLNDIKVALNLYGFGKDTTKVRKLRSRINKKILDSVFSNISSKFIQDERIPTIIYLNKLQSIGYALKSLSITDLGNSIFEHILKVGARYDAADLCYEASLVLFNHYSLTSPDPKKLIYFEKQVEHYCGDVSYVKRVTLIYGKLSYIFITNRSGNEVYKSKEAVFFFKELLKIKEETDNYIVQLLILNMEASFYMADNNYSLVIESCEKANLMLEKKSFKDNALSWHIHYNTAFSYLRLKEYDMVDKNFEALKSFLTIGSKYWYIYKGLEFVRHCLKGELISTFALSKEVFSIPDINSYKSEHSTWLCRVFFLKSILKMERFNNDRERLLDLLPRINENKCKIQLSDFAKDKMGMNITLKTISIIDKLIDNKYDDVDDLIDSFSQYNYKYLTNDDSFRSKCFINMLKSMQKAHFHPVRTRQLSATLYKKLLTKDSRIEEVNIYVELITFDQLWELILEILENNKNK